MQTVGKHGKIGFRPQYKLGVYGICYLVIEGNRPLKDLVKHWSASAFCLSTLSPSDRRKSSVQELVKHWSAIAFCLLGMPPAERFHASKLQKLRYRQAVLSRNTQCSEATMFQIKHATVATLLASHLESNLQCSQNLDASKPPWFTSTMFPSHHAFMKPPVFLLWSIHQFGHPENYLFGS